MYRKAFSKCLNVSYEKLQPVRAEKNNPTRRLCHLFEYHKKHVNISKIKGDQLYKQYRLKHVHVRIGDRYKFDCFVCALIQIYCRFIYH